MNRFDAKILNRLQQGLPLSPRPFRELAEELGLKEESLLQRIQVLREEGVIRRLGGVFDSPGLGMASTLCAMQVPAERIDEVADRINSYPEVTHNYLRDDDLNLWFTVTAPSPEEMKRVVREIENATGMPVISMPVRKRFKIKVVFDLDED